MKDHYNLYRNCLLCPRECGVDRLAGQTGWCGETAGLRLASASIHRGEEPPVTGTGGSGTVFVSGCNLGCSFCQNLQISREGMGRTVEEPEFADICLALQEHGAENVNIVTGSHAAPALALGIRTARERGLTIPVLWNSSAYESPQTLFLLKDLVDGWLPDLKTLDPVLAQRLFNAPNYVRAAPSAIQTMLSFAPSAGVIIRHLVLPDALESTRQVLRWFSDNATGAATLSLMTQYTPVDADAQPAIPRHYISETEYKTALDYLDEFGIEDGFYQELSPDSEWLPDFTRANPFSSALSTPIWHWKDGFL